MARRAWSHFPQRFLNEERYLQLTQAAVVLLHRLYMTCDRWGRGSASSNVLRFKVFQKRSEVESEIKALLDGGFITIGVDRYEQPVYQLVEYDEGAPRAATRNRAPSQWQMVTG